MIPWNHSGTTPSLITLWSWFFMNQFEASCCWFPSIAVGTAHLILVQKDKKKMHDGHLGDSQSRSAWTVPLPGEVLLLWSLELTPPLFLFFCFFSRSFSTKGFTSEPQNCWFHINLFLQRLNVWPYFCYSSVSQTDRNSIGSNPVFLTFMVWTPEYNISDSLC